MWLVFPKFVCGLLEYQSLGWFSGREHNKRGTASVTLRGDRLRFTLHSAAGEITPQLLFVHVVEVIGAKRKPQRTLFRCIGFERSERCSVSVQKVEMWVGANTEVCCGAVNVDFRQVQRKQDLQAKERRIRRALIEREVLITCAHPFVCNLYTAFQVSYCVCMCVCIFFLAVKLWGEGMAGSDHASIDRRSDRSIEEPNVLGWTESSH